MLFTILVLISFSAVAHILTTHNVTSMKNDIINTFNITAQYGILCNDKVTPCPLGRIFGGFLRLAFHDSVGHGLLYLLVNLSTYCIAIICNLLSQVAETDVLISGIQITMVWMMLSTNCSLFILNTRQLYLELTFGFLLRMLLYNMHPLHHIHASLL